MNLHKLQPKRVIKGLKFRIESRLLALYSVFDYIRTNKNIYKNPSICVFYQCYKQPKSVIETLASFRHVYPTSTIHLYCDNGLDFSHVARHFDCKYEYLSNRSGNGDTLYFLHKEQVLSYINRLVHTAQNSQEDFVLILEDDARVYNKIQNLHFDWNSIKSNHHYSGKKLTSLLRARNTSIPFYIPNMYFTGCGGAMLNRTFLVKHFSDYEKVASALDELAPYIQKQWDGALPQDAILTALIFYFGGTVGWYPGFTEVKYWKYLLRPFLGRIDIVHNDKSAYNVPLTESENKIFLGN